MLRFALALNASVPCCPNLCVMGTIGISDKCQWNHKKYMARQRCEPGTTAWELFIRTSLPSSFANKSEQKYIEKKYDRIEWIIFQNI